MLVNRPPMGWNSWNTFSDKISDELIREMADTIVKLGLDKIGYNYVRTYVDSLPFGRVIF